MINNVFRLVRVVLAAADEGGNFGDDSYNEYTNKYASDNLPEDPTGLNTIGNIFSKLLPYIYVVAGLILLLLLIAGGIGLMTSAGDPDKSKAAFGKIKGGLIGFLIIFVAYFVAKIVETILGVSFM